MAQRHSLYSGIHKAIRLMLSDFVTRASQVEWNDRESVAAMVRLCDVAFEMLNEHAEHENTFIGPVLAEKRPDVHANIGAAHHEQEQQFVTLRAQLAAINPASEDAAAEGHCFVVAVARVVGELITHMSDEEEIVMPTLWEALDERALGEVHQRLLASIPPPKMMATMRWMIPALSHPERVELLSGVRNNAPPPVFAALLGVARAHLPAAALARLESDLVPPSQRAA